MDSDPKLPAKPTQEFLKEKKWPSQSRDLFSVTEDKTESRKSHKQAASEGRRGRRGRGNTGFIDVHGFQTLSNY